MPYSKSQARKLFDTEVKQIIATIKLSFKHKATPLDTKKYVLSFSIVLCSAKVEVYIEDFFNSWIGAVNNNPCLVSTIPASIRVVHLNETFLKEIFKKYILEENETKFIDALISKLGNPLFNLTDISKQSPRLDAKKIYARKKYPSPENISLLFKRAGIKDIFTEINRSSRSDLKTSLASYNDVRTAIAHNGIPVGINDKDVIEKLESMQKVIAHIDKALFKHVCRYTSISTWVT